MNTIKTIETMVEIVQEKQDKAIIESVNKWIAESSGLRSAVLIDEDKLRISTHILSQRMTAILCVNYAL